MLFNEEMLWMQSEVRLRNPAPFITNIDGEWALANCSTSIYWYARTLEQRIAPPIYPAWRMTWI